MSGDDFVPTLHVAVSVARKGLEDAEGVDIYDDMAVLHSFAYLRQSLRHLLAALDEEQADEPVPYTLTDQPVA